MNGNYQWNKHMSRDMRYCWQWLLLFGLIFLVACSGPARGDSPAAPTAPASSVPKTAASEVKSAAPEPISYTITY